MEIRATNRQGSNIVLNCRIPVQPAQAIMCDISTTGCRIELFDGFTQRGSTIFFEIDEKNQIAGQVVWAHGKEAGVRFMHKLSPTVIDLLELR